MDELFEDMRKRGLVSSGSGSVVYGVSGGTIAFWKILDCARYVWGGGFKRGEYAIDEVGRN